jgi:hypothetical protein
MNTWDGGSGSVGLVAGSSRWFESSSQSIESVISSAEIQKGLPSLNSTQGVRQSTLKVP